MSKTFSPKAYPAAVACILAMTALPLDSAQAYVGPGLSAGAGAVVLGIIGSIFLALFAVVWYPLKRLLKKGRPAAKAAKGGTRES